MTMHRSPRRRTSSRAEGRVDLFSQLVQRANRPQPNGGVMGRCSLRLGRPSTRGTFPLEQIVQIFGFLRVPSPVICDFGGIVGLIYRGAML
jgi:hypothetical protein